MSSLLYFILHHPSFRELDESLIVRHFKPHTQCSSLPPLVQSVLLSFHQTIDMSSPPISTTLSDYGILMAVCLHIPFTLDIYFLSLFPFSITHNHLIYLPPLLFSWPLCQSLQWTCEPLLPAHTLVPPSGWQHDRVWERRRHHLCVGCPQSARHAANGWPCWCGWSGHSLPCGGCAVQCIV